MTHTAYAVVWRNLRCEVVRHDTRCALRDVFGFYSRKRDAERNAKRIQRNLHPGSILWRNLIFYRSA